MCLKCGVVITPGDLTCINCKGKQHSMGSVLGYWLFNKPVSSYAPQSQYKIGDILYEVSGVFMEKKLNEIKTTTFAESPLWVLGAVYFNPNLNKPVELTEQEDQYLQVDEDSNPIHGLGV